MKAKKIIFPTDFSHCGDAALKMATSLARDTGATLLIVHVEEPPVAYGGGEMYYGMPDPVTDDLRTMLEQVGPPDPQVSCERRLITGDPATEQDLLERLKLEMEEDLSETLFEAGVLPYYLHLLDPVAGAAHFAVSLAEARAIMDRLRAEMPGYLVPKLVRELPGGVCKEPIG